MSVPRPSSPTFQQRLVAGAAAGVVSAAAYAVTQEVDMRLTSNRTDDLVLMGRLVTSNGERARRVGFGIHLMNGAAVGVAYTVLGRDHLPGSPAVRGIIFSLLENTLLYPLALLEEKHPAFREGELDSYRTATAFGLETARHVVFGAVLGPLSERLLQR